MFVADGIVSDKILVFILPLFFTDFPKCALTLKQMLPISPTKRCSVSWCFSLYLTNQHFFLLPTVLCFARLFSFVNFFSRAAFPPSGALASFLHRFTPFFPA